MVRLLSTAQDVLSEEDRLDFHVEADDPTDLLVEVYDEGNFVGHFRLSTMPANPLYVVSWAVKVHEDYQGIGIGQYLLDLRIKIVKNSGAHTYLNTVRWDNDVQVHIMKKYGFEPARGRPEDDNNTALWAKSVRDSELVAA